MSKKYIGVDAENIRLIKHILSDESISKKIKYPKPHMIGFSEETGKDIIEKNGEKIKTAKLFFILSY